VIHDAKGADESAQIDLAFEPARMSVRAGDVVEMTFHNSGGQLHDFTIDQTDAEVMEMTPGGGPAAQ